MSQTINPPRSAFRHRPFRAYFAGSLVSYLGTWFEKVALGWFTWELTQSTFWTGFVAVALTLPTGLLGPIVGVYAERWNIRVLTIVFNGAMALVSVALFCLAITPGVTIAPIAILSVLLGVVTAFYQPARLMLVNDVVPRAYLTSAVGLNAIAYNASRVVGPALAGVVIATLGTAPAFLVNAVTYLPITVVIGLIPLAPRPPRGAAGALFSELSAGLRYAVRHDLIRWALLVVIVSAVGTRGILEILPAIVGGVLAGASNDLAILTAAAGAGALIASVVIGVFTPTLARLRRVSAWLLPTSTLVCGLTGLGTGVWFTSAILMFIGFSATFISVSCQAIIQVSVTETFRARLLTWWSTATFGGITLGTLLLGVLGDILPLGAVIAGISILVGLAALLLWWRQPPFGPETQA